MDKRDLIKDLDQKTTFSKLIENMLAMGLEDIEIPAYIESSGFSFKIRLQIRNLREELSWQN